MFSLKSLLIFVASASVSVLLAFVCFEVDTLTWLIQHLGLPILWVLVPAWAYYGLRCLGSRAQFLAGVNGWLSGVGRWDILFVLLVSVCLHLQQAHQFKVLMDEISLLNTSRVIYETQQVYSPGGLDYKNDAYVLSREGYVGKRPYLFPFAVSVLHFLTGYRWWNGFLLNALLTPVLFGLMIGLVRAYVRRPLVAYVAVLLLVSFPFMGQVVTSSGMELLNACLVALVALSAVLYTRKPSNERMQWMFASACLLAYARYESIIYILAVALVWVLVCRRERRLQLCAATAIFPLALIPLVWIIRVVESKSSEYFQHEMLGLDYTFSIAYLQGNLSHFFRFLFEPQALSLNAPVTVALILIVLLIVGLRCLGIGPSGQRSEYLRVLGEPLSWVLAIASISQALLLFYLWGDLNDPVVTRIALPFFMMWLLVAVCLWGVGFAAKIKAGPILCVVGICLWCGIFAKKENLAERTNIPVLKANLAGEWIRSEMGWRDAVFSWNNQLFLPYRVQVFPEYNLWNAFDAVKQMQAQGIVNRVLLYYDSERSKELWSNKSPYAEFLGQGGLLKLLKSQQIDGGSKIQLYLLNFEDYQAQAEEVLSGVN